MRGRSDGASLHLPSTVRLHDVYRRADGCYPIKGERWCILEAFDKPSLRVRLLDNEIIDGSYHQKLNLLIAIYRNWDCKRSWGEELAHLARLFFPFAVKSRVVYSHG